MINHPHSRSCPGILWVGEKQWFSFSPEVLQGTWAQHELHVNQRSHSVLSSKAGHERHRKTVLCYLVSTQTKAEPIILPPCSSLTQSILLKLSMFNLTVINTGLPPCPNRSKHAAQGNSLNVCAEDPERSPLWLEF